MRGAILSLLAFFSFLASAQAIGFHRAEISLAPDVAPTSAYQFYLGAKVLMPAPEHRAAVFYPGEKVLAPASEWPTPVAFASDALLLQELRGFSISRETLLASISDVVVWKDVDARLTEIEKRDLSVCGIGKSDERQSHDEVIKEIVDRVLDAVECVDRLKSLSDERKEWSWRRDKNEPAADLVAAYIQTQPAGVAAFELRSDHWMVAKIISSNSKMPRLTGPVYPPLGMSGISKSDLPIGLFDIGARIPKLPPYL